MGGSSPSGPTRARQVLKSSLRLRLRRLHRREAEAEAELGAAAPAAASAPHIAGTPAPGSPAGCPHARAVLHGSSGPPLLPPSFVTPLPRAPLAAFRWGFQAAPEPRTRLAGDRLGLPKSRRLQNRPLDLPRRWRCANDVMGPDSRECACVGASAFISTLRRFTPGKRFSERSCGGQPGREKRGLKHLKGPALREQDCVEYVIAVAALFTEH
ncbi:uncharacterized protein LOC117090821 [Trachypithecus francoisi]|uniref:uncharacterized protein LOC117090821 n=1 Tax=Trachypithecus francoisi TaxID=54180 RepID=UPI00141A8871|nr:uncharacterized protein LOC117090821 [Trachypithecus francoisi]